MIPQSEEILSSPLPSPKMPKRSIPNAIENAYINPAFDGPVSKNTSPLPTRLPKPPSTTAPPGIDIISNVIGDFGIWQLRTILIIFLCKIPAAWFMACIMYTAPELYPISEFKCEKDGNVTDNQCYMVNDEGEEARCDQFSYNYDFYSLVMQFDLVCIWGSVYLAWTQYWHLFGVLVGGVVGTKMMIRLSPRKVYIVGMVAQIFCGTFTAFAKDFSLHCLGRVISAVCCAIMFTAGQAIFADITGGIYRIGAIILYDTFWSVGVILLPGLSSFFGNWTGIYLGITYPTILMMILLKWTPDSPRWLLKHARSDADLLYVENMVRVGAHINERTFKIPANFKEKINELSQTLKSAPLPAKWTQLWQGHRAKTHMIAAHIALALLVINFMGMLLNIRSFGRQYLVPNTIAMGFSEIVGCFLALHFTLRYNKWKWQCAGVFNIFAGLLGCLGWTFTGSETMNPIAKVVLWMILATVSKSAVSCAQSMILACMNELVSPAPKKIPFVFSVVTWARIWLLSAPFFNVLKAVDVALSLTAYCIFSIIAGICTCFLVTPRGSAIIAVPPVNEKESSSQSGPIWSVERDGCSSRL